MKFKLSKQQQKHLDSIVKSTEKRMRDKYKLGAEKHKGNLWQKDCLTELFDELIDGMVYLQTELLKRERTK